MVEERRDFLSLKESSSEKQKREAELRELGMQHRQDVAMHIVNGERRAIGGAAAALSSTGDVVRDDASVLLSPTGSVGGDSDMPSTKKRRRNPKHREVLQQLLNSDDTSELETCRLNFEMEKLTKEHALRQLEMQQAGEARREDMDLQLKLQKNELAVRREEMQERQNARDQDIKLRLAEFQATMDLKMKKLDLMMLQMQNKQ